MTIPRYELNDLGQPVNYPVPGWVSPLPPQPKTLIGRLSRIEPLHPAHHAESLWNANQQDSEGRMWTYLPYGPFETFDDYSAWLESRCQQDDPMFYAIVDAATHQAIGVASYMRIRPSTGSIEVGHLAYSPLLQGTTAATEAMYLMMNNAFTLGYRRYEWECDSLNAASRAAAQRLGFSPEGVFRQECLTKGRNCDTAWYSVIDREWPMLQEVFLHWLNPQNFDAEGKQRTRLSDLTRPLLKQCG